MMLAGGAGSLGGSLGRGTAGTRIGAEEAGCCLLGACSSEAWGCTHY